MQGNKHDVLRRCNQSTITCCTADDAMFAPASGTTAAAASLSKLSCLACQRFYMTEQLHDTASAGSFGGLRCSSSERGGGAVSLAILPAQLLLVRYHCCQLLLLLLLQLLPPHQQRLPLQSNTTRASRN